MPWNCARCSKRGARSAWFGNSMPGARVDIAEIRAAGGLKPWLAQQKVELARPVLKPVPKRPKPVRRSEHEEQCLVIARAEALKLAERARARIPDSPSPRLAAFMQSQTADTGRRPRRQSSRPRASKPAFRTFFFPWHAAVFMASTSR